MSVTSQERFIGQVNEDNETTLTADDVIFGSVTDTQAERSKTRIVAARGSGYRGGVTLHYQRLKLGKLFGFFQPKVQVSTGSEPTPEFLIASVELQYGLKLDPKDVTISKKVTEEGEFFLVEAKDTSLVYSDSTEFLLEFEQIEIGTIVGDDSQNYVYPTTQEDQTRKIDGLVYSGGWLVPEAGVELSEFLVGNEPDHNLMWLTQTLAGEDWYIDDNPGENNLFGAVVEYNGDSAGFELIPQDVVTILSKQEGGLGKVLALKLSEVHCVNFAGALTFYY